VKDAADPVIVRVAGGRIAGASEAGVAVFKGVPFAAPLVGANRWRAPQPAPRWDGVRDATRFGPACPQPDATAGLAGRLMQLKPSARAFMRAIGDLGAPTGEASLVLNVWTPATDPRAKLPVLVFIHGGSLTAGAGSQPLYDGTALAKAGLVVVTINYRLGVLGFVGGDQLFPDGLGVANRGFLDQVAALRWVSENIAAFGGDPALVTVAGESAGATSALMMAVTPSTGGLIRRVISLSGAPLAYPHAEMESFARDYFEALGVTDGDGEALAELTDAQIFKARPTPSQFLYRHSERYGALGADHLSPLAAATGSALFPEAPLDFLRGGKRRDLDLMIGTCRDEARLWSLILPLPGPIGARMMFGVFASIMNPPGRPQEALRAYRKAMPGASAFAARERAMTDCLFRKPSLAFAEAMAGAAPGHVFLYRYDWPSPALGGAFGAMHGLDLPGVFQTYGALADALGPEAGARPAGDALHAAVVSFVKTGSPVIPGAPAWPAYEPAAKPCMVIDKTCEVRPDLDAAFEPIW
jgi:para-nitrobenzyl esterase